MAQPSSSSSGFFQALPVVPPQYTSLDTLPQSQRAKHKTNIDASDDKVLARVLNLYLPANATPVTAQIHHLARLSLNPSVLVHSTDAETNHPVIRPRTTFGEENTYDPLWTTAGWQKLKDIGVEEGIVSVAYDKQHALFNRRIHQFANIHVWNSTGTMTGCPQSMTDGAATLMLRHLNDPDGEQPGRAKVFAEAYRRLVSRDPKEAWTSGQWMTERTGGSDVSGTETLAVRVPPELLRQEAKEDIAIDAVGMPLGPWKIDGFKWFSSATDSEMAVLLARTSKGGLSAFYIPMRRTVAAEASSGNALVEEPLRPRTELNGVHISRLKNKLGTKSLPTAELELRGARGWLIGSEGQGVKEISAILNITRLWTATGSAANWARGLAICRAYSQVRKVRGGLLVDNPAHLRWMAEETIKHTASAHFGFLGVALQGALEQDWEKMVGSTKAAVLIPRDKTTIANLLRLLLPVMKAQNSVASVHGLRQCMECLGGVGYCENNEDGGVMNIAKIYRDNLVNPIWEGTVSVMAEDVVRVLIDKRLGNGDILGNLFAPWIDGVLGKVSDVFKDEVVAVKHALHNLLKLVHGATKEELLYHGRDILEPIETIVSGLMLMYDATVQPDPIAQEVAVRYIRYRLKGSLAQSRPKSWKATVPVDRAIFLGSPGGASASSAKL